MVELLEEIKSLYVDGGGEIARHDLAKVPFSKSADIGDECVFVKRHPPLLTRTSSTRKVDTIWYHLTMNTLSVHISGEKSKRQYKDFPPDAAIEFIGADDPDAYFFANIDDKYGFTMLS